MDHPIAGLDDATIGDFWSWAYSDVLSNLNRSTLTEFLVASALDVVDAPRVEWDLVDLRYCDRGIEVKSAAYLQSWQQDSPSTIRYDIARKQGWDARTNTYADRAVRSADCYVFCLYPEQDVGKANVLDVDAWEFYVVATHQIERELGAQKSVGLNRLRNMVEPVTYEDLRARIDSVLTLA